MTLKRKAITAAAVGLTTVATCAWVGVAHRYDRVQMTNHQELSPSEAKSRKQEADLTKAGALKEENGHLVKAEAIYRKVIAGNRISLVRLRLAKLLDREGRTSEAMSEYQWLVDPPKGVISSLADDSLQLGHYADLCLKQGMNATARQMYVRAAKNCDTFLGDALTPTRAGRIDTEKTPLAKLRSDAYFAVAVGLLSHDEHSQGLEKMELALSLDPSSALAREGYAEALMGRKNTSSTPQEQRWQAEHDATGPLKEAIHKRREMQQEIISGGSIRHINGKIVITNTEYKPTRQAPTPHVADPIVPNLP